MHAAAPVIGGPAPVSDGPALGANAFPEVTRRFCRLPLSTLVYRLEASSLGDRMRLFGTAEDEGLEVDLPLLFRGDGWRTLRYKSGTAFPA